MSFSNALTQIIKSMKHIILFIIILGSFTAYSQKQGIGLRLGDPLGATYKKYLGKTNAVELVIGSASARWHNNYYLNSFDEYSEYDSYRYQNHAVQSTFYIQGRYLFHFPLPVENMEGKLDWYWGVGGLLKIAKVKYTYRDIDSPFATGTDIKNDLDIGPEGILGMEYTFQDIPMTVFGEGSMMLEFLDRPLTIRAFGGLGVRYNF